MRFDAVRPAALLSLPRSNGPTRCSRGCRPYRRSLAPMQSSSACAPTVRRGGTHGGASGRRRRRAPHCGARRVLPFLASLKNTGIFGIFGILVLFSRWLRYLRISHTGKSSTLPPLPGRVWKKPRATAAGTRSALRAGQVHILARARVLADGPRPAASHRDERTATAQQRIFRLSILTTSTTPGRRRGPAATATRESRAGRRRRRATHTRVDGS